MVLQPKLVVPFYVFPRHVVIGVIFRTVDDGIFCSLIEGPILLFEFPGEPSVPALEAKVGLRLVANYIIVVDSWRVQPSVRFCCEVFSRLWRVQERPIGVEDWFYSCVHSVQCEENLPIICVEEIYHEGVEGHAYYSLVRVIGRSRYDRSKLIEKFLPRYTVGNRFALDAGRGLSFFGIILDHSRWDLVESALEVHLDYGVFLNVLPEGFNLRNFFLIFSGEFCKLLLPLVDAVEHTFNVGPTS